MKAVVQERFGPPDTLRVADVDPPAAGPDDVLIRVRAASLNPWDWHMLRGDPYLARLSGSVGLRRPKQPVAGIDAAGVVEEVGANVRGFTPGDAVLGFFPGAFAEYARTESDKVVLTPTGLSFEQAAALPMAGTTALRGLRDVGRVRAGHRILVNGASGGVGSFAVQLGVAFGAEVTGVCSTANVELVRSLGAGHVVDRTREDFTDTDVRYDLILDNVGNRPLRRLRRLLAPGGTLAANAGGSPGHVVGAIGYLGRAALLGLFGRRRMRPVPTRLTRDDLVPLTELAADGRVTPVIGRTYPLVDVAEGLRFLEQGHARGKLVVTVP